MVEGKFQIGPKNKPLNIYFNNENEEGEDNITVDCDLFTYGMV